LIRKYKLFITNLNKMKNKFLILFALTLSVSVYAQSKKEMDIEAIKSMCGCYEVGFNFAETFNYSNDTLYRPSKVKHDKGLELALLIEDEDNKISIQHLLVVGPKDRQMVVKHWRQDWLFQNTDLYSYNGDNQWLFDSKKPEEVEGQWTQKVYQVDDSPRYEGTGTWVFIDGKQYWESRADAPLPRREYTIRNDYNVTTRTNRHEIVDSGWLHIQDNDKVLRKNGEDVLVAQEKGYNTYVKVSDERCAAAMTYWEENEKLWKKTRKVWDNVFAKHTDLVLEDKVAGKKLWEHLFDLDSKVKSKEISEIIESFVK